MILLTVAAVFIYFVYLIYFRKSKYRIWWLSGVSILLIASSKNIRYLIAFLVIVSMLWFYDLYINRRCLTLLSIIAAAWQISLNTFKESMSNATPTFVVLCLWFLYILINFYSKQPSGIGISTRYNKSSYDGKTKLKVRSKKPVEANKNTDVIPENKLTVSDNLSYTDKIITRYVDKPTYSSESSLHIPNLITSPDQDSFDNFSYSRRFWYDKIFDKYNDTSEMWFTNTNIQCEDFTGSTVENCLVDVQKMESEFIVWKDGQPLTKCDGNTVSYGIYRGRKCVNVPDHIHAGSAVSRDNGNAILHNTVYFMYRGRYYRYLNNQHIFHHSNMVPLWKLAYRTKQDIFLVGLQLLPMYFDIPNRGSCYKMTLKMYIR